MENLNLGDATRVIGIYSKNYDWFNKHYEELVHEFPNKIVAIDNEKVIAYGDDLEEVKKKTKGISGLYIGSAIAEKLLWVL